MQSPRIAVVGSVWIVTVRSEFNAAFNNEKDAYAYSEYATMKAKAKRIYKYPYTVNKYDLYGPEQERT